MHGINGTAMRGLKLTERARVFFSVSKVEGERDGRERIEGRKKGRCEFRGGGGAQEEKLVPFFALSDPTNVASEFNGRQAGH